MQYREVGSGIVQTMSVSVVSGDSIVEAIISNLDPSTIYTIEVAAANSARTGVYSYPVIAETPQSEVYIIMLTLTSSTALVHDKSKPLIILSRVLGI